MRHETIYSPHCEPTLYKYVDFVFCTHVQADDLMLGNGRHIMELISVYFQRQDASI